MPIFTSNPARRTEKEKLKARQAAFTPVQNARVNQAIQQSQNGFKGQTLNDHGLPAGRTPIIQDAPEPAEGAKFRKQKYANGTQSIKAPKKGKMQSFFEDGDNRISNLSDRDLDKQTKEYMTHSSKNTPMEDKLFREKADRRWGKQKYAEGTQSISIGNPFKKRPKSTSESDKEGEMATATKVDKMIPVLPNLAPAQPKVEDQLDAVANDSKSLSQANTPSNTHSLAQIQDMEKVKQHQMKLNKYGANLKVDGMWGAKTEAASRDLYSKYKTQSSPTGKSSNMKKGGKEFVEQKAKSTFKKTQSVVDSDQYGKQYQDDAPTIGTVKQQTPKASTTQSSSQSSVFGKYGGIKSEIDNDAKNKIARGESVNGTRYADYGAYQQDQEDKTDRMIPGRRQAREKEKARIANNNQLFDREYERQARGFAAKNREARKTSVVDSSNKEKQYRDDDSIAEVNDRDKNWSRIKASADSSVRADKNFPSVFKSNSVVKRDTTGDAQSDKNWNRLKGEADFEIQGENYRKTGSRISISKTNVAGGKSKAYTNEYGDNPSPEARRRVSHSDSVFSKRSTDKVEANLAKVRRTSSYKADKRAPRKSFMGL